MPRQTARILVVCTANICRSPMAERLLAEYLARRVPDARAVISSAGTHARPGDPAASGMQRIAEGWGLDLDYHRSRRVDQELAASQDLVITMEDAHRTVVSRLAPGLGSRTFIITELAALMDATGPPVAGTLPQRVAAWHAARARTALDVTDVGDPYGGPTQGYETTAWQLAGLVELIGPHLAAAVNGS